MSSNFLRILSNATVSIRTFLAVCALLIALCSSFSCFAAEVATFGGTEYDNHGQGFSYLGVDVSGTVSGPWSIAARIMPNYLTYKYYSGNTLIKADSPGVYGLAGIKLLSGQTVLGLYAGVDFRDTDLSPDDRSSAVRGATTAGVVQGELYTTFASRTTLTLFASYGGATDFIYEKGRIKQQITNLDYQRPFTFSVGLEQFVGHNEDFDAQGVAAVMELYHIPNKVAVGVHCGYKHDSTFGNGIYYGLELYKGF